MHDGQEDLSRYAWLSIGTGIVVFALKLYAYFLTDSVGLLSDALESTVNIVAAVVALVALKAAARPGDERHHFGLSKAEYFSALFEGLMILIAAGLIMFTAIPRFLNPQPLEDLGIGLFISGIATVLNFVVAGILMRAGLKHRSIVLQADSKHLMTDVWTSGGVIIAVLLVGWTGWLRLDPLIAMAVALNIVFAGLKLIGSSAMGLLDASLPEEENALIVEVLQRHQTENGAVPRAADPGVGAPAVRLHARAGPGRVERHSGARPAGGGRGGHPPRPARHRHRHPSGAHRGPTGMGRPTPRRSDDPRRGPLERRLSPEGRRPSPISCASPRRPQRNQPPGRVRCAAPATSHQKRWIRAAARPPWANLAPVPVARLDITSLLGTGTSARSPDTPTDQGGFQRN